MKQILVPIDGGAQSDAAVKALADLFPPERANVTLLFVREDIDSTTSVILDQMARQTMPQLDAVAAQIPQYTVEKVVDFGIPGHTILRYAREHEMDLILITRCSNSSFPHFMGSVATHLVKHAHCPVIVVPVEKAE